MADITLVAQRRTQTGSGPAGRLRAAGKIPGVVYGKGIDPISVVVDHRELRNTFNNADARAAAFTLSVDGVAHQVKIHEIQRDPVKGGAAHVDFITV